MHIGWTELLVIIILAIVLLGSGKFPKIMKNIADGIKSFKKEMKQPEKKVKTKKIILQIT